MSSSPSSFSAHRRQALAAALALAGSAASLPSWAQKADKVFRIGHQKGWLSLLKARGTLEKRLAPLGVSVTWTETPSSSTGSAATFLGIVAWLLCC